MQENKEQKTSKNGHFLRSRSYPEGQTLRKFRQWAVESLEAVQKADKETIRGLAFINSAQHLLFNKTFCCKFVYFVFLYSIGIPFEVNLVWNVIFLPIYVN